MKNMFSKRWDPHRPVPTIEDFDKKLTETDAYLQILIDQVKNFERRLDKCDNEEERCKYLVVKDKANEMLESIKHSIVLLQIAKNTAHPVNGVYNINSSYTELNLDHSSGLPILSTLGDSPLTSNVEHGIEPAVECVEEFSSRRDYAREKRFMPHAASNVSSIMDDHGAGSKKLPGPFGDSLNPYAAMKGSVGPSNISSSIILAIPETSYSSSEDEDYFDAKDDDEDLGFSASVPRKYEDPLHKFGTGMRRETQPHSLTPVLKDGVVDYDAIYEDEDEEELGSVANHGSVISHLLSQVKLGMDLTKVVLPTFILERRSLLEMYADFFAHPDLFVSIVDFQDPRERIVQVLRWYLSAFHAGRRSSVAKKPYNPILGEIFRCVWDIPETEKTDEEGDRVPDGPVPWSSKNQLAFIAEQVSHHPPISAFYAEHCNKRISFCAHIWTKSKFLGLSIGVHMIGQGCISVLDCEEEYIVTFPNGYGRSILSVPWVELGGSTTITCAKTGYSANIEFLTKPFYGGKKHRVVADVFQPNDKKSFLTVTGEWNGCMQAKWANTGDTEVFVDTTSIPVVKKIVPLVSTQEEMESRRLWKEVTAGLRLRDIEKATAAKYHLEQKQRLEAKERKDQGLSWETKCFHEVGEHWVYDNPLITRLNHASSATS